MSGGDVVLVASLGRSPPVITEAVDALIEMGLRPSRVYVVTTSDPTIIQRCIPILRDEFAVRYPGVGLEVRTLTRDDIYDEKDNEEFMKMVADILYEESILRESHVYLSLAGGRKTMSAVMAILGWIYGAKAIIHVLVPPDVERRGHIENLERLGPEERGAIMHPSSDVRRIVVLKLGMPPPLPTDIIKKIGG